MKKFDVLKKFVGEAKVNIARFTGDDDGGLDFLDQPDECENVSEIEIENAKKIILEVAATITPEQTKGKNLLRVVATELKNMGNKDAELIATQISGDTEYIKADLMAK